MRFYYHPSPNPLKVALLLEEAGLPYEMVPVDTRKGEQHSAAFKAINPNAKTPALVDGSGKCLTAMRFCFTWLRSRGSFCRATRWPRGRRCIHG